MLREIVLLEESVGRKDVRDYFVEVRQVPGEDGKAELNEITEVMAVGGRRSEPVKFE